MIVLILTPAQASAIVAVLPAGELQTSIARDVAAELVPIDAVPELVIARPRWEYVECVYDEATAARCWRAFTRAWRATPRETGGAPARAASRTVHAR